VNAKNESDNTPLQEAAEQNHFNLVHLLVQAGADVNSINEHHETPLFQAVSNNNLQVVDLLLNNGVDVNVKDIANENILRFTMANFRFLDPLILKALLRHGINFADSKKYEELVILAFPDSPRMVSDILTPAPQVTQSNELKDTEGNSIIVYISGQGQYDKLKPLMQLPVYREDMLSLNEALKMAIYCITNNTITHKQRQAYQEIINLLVTYGAKVDSHDFSTKKLFFKAAKTNNVPIIDLFLQAGIDPLLQNQNGKTAVEIANEYGNTKIIDALAKKIAINLNLANTKNDTKASSILEEFINKVSPAIGLLIGSYFMSIAKQKNLQLA
ncbi:MAG TPA: ankyrin repeat domain-containing protein, partial [Candidatus Babeliaceae bacterium]|nr:ankyrin repeat domain-containing protein [Candidatus Babeliaceae bacterium]